MNLCLALTHEPVSLSRSSLPEAHHLLYESSQAIRAQGALSLIDSHIEQENYWCLLDWLLVASFNDYEEPCQKYYHEDGPLLCEYTSKKLLKSLDAYLVRVLESLIWASHFTNTEEKL